MFGFDEEQIAAFGLTAVTDLLRAQAAGDDAQVEELLRAKMSLA